MKVFIILAVTVAMLALSTNAMATVGGPPTGLGLGLVGPPFDLFQNVILQREADKILATPGLDEDLRQQTNDVLENAQMNFDNCKTIPLVGFQYSCFFRQFKASQNELKAIREEVKRRAEAAAATEAATEAAADGSA